MPLFYEQLNFYASSLSVSPGPSTLYELILNQATALKEVAWSFTYTHYIYYMVYSYQFFQEGIKDLLEKLKTILPQHYQVHKYSLSGWSTSVRLIYAKRPIIGPSRPTAKCVYNTRIPVCINCSQIAGNIREPKKSAAETESSSSSSNTQHSPAEKANNNYIVREKERSGERARNARKR